MPTLVFRERRLLLGGDEFMVPYASVAIGRTLWVVFLVVTLIVSGSYMFDAQCTDAGYAAFFYEVVSITVGVISIIVEFRIAVVSTYGTIIDPGPRTELMTRGLSYKSVLAVVQLLLALIGSFLVIYVPLSTNCGNDSLAIMATIMAGLIVTVISQYLDAAGMYCCLISFTSSDDNWQDDDHESNVGGIRRGYEDFCRTAWRCLACCTCTFNVLGDGAEESDFTYVSRVFSRLLSARHFMDLVATDIAAGLILLRHVQKTQDYRRRAELLEYDSTLSPATATTAITADPGKIQDEQETAASRATARASPQDAPKAVHGGDRGTGQELPLPSPPTSGLPLNVPRTDEETQERKVASDGDWPEATVGDIFRGQSLRCVQSPGSVPLEERPWRHRKYYKVTKNEKVVDLQNDKDRCLLEELGHFVKYADVMYSVWGTLIADPWSGVRRFIRRRRWCPLFLKRRVRRNQRRANSSIAGISSSTVGRACPLDRAGSTASAASDGVGSASRDSGRIVRRSSAASNPIRESLYANTYDYKAEIRGDSVWGSYETALRTELPEGAELVLAHFNNCLDETPYCVAVDHVWQSVVITIRGSHSFEDFLVDAMAEPRSLESVGREWGFDGTGMAAHDGILRRTEWIRRDLEESGILRRLLGDTRRHNLSPEHGARAEEEKEDEHRVPLAATAGGTFCASYTVRVVGHSLGAGCAALLTLLLKSAYPSVRGIAVSPPGGLVSEGACREATERVVTSLVLNDDVIPRMSWLSIEVLADQVLNVLGRSRVSKLFVMRSLLRTDEEAHNPNLYMVDQEETAGSWASMIGGERRPGAPGRGNARVVPEHEEDGDGGSSGDEETGGEQRATGDGESVSLGGSAKFHEQLWRYREHLKKEERSRRHLHQLSLPGRILHLVNTEVMTTSNDDTNTQSQSRDIDDDLDGCCFSCCTGSTRYEVGGGWGDRGEENDCCSCCCTGRQSSIDNFECSRSGYAEMGGRGSDARSSRGGRAGALRRNSSRWERDSSKKRKKERRRRIFTPVWASPDDLAKIRVTPAFLVDHNPEEILPALEQTLEDLGVFVR